jgi:hypothetical protein
VAYLWERSVRRRALTRHERRLLGPMIRRSSNGAAADVLARVGTRLGGAAHFPPPPNPLVIANGSADPPRSATSGTPPSSR